MKNLIQHSLQEAQQKLQDFIANPNTIVCIEQAANIMADALEKQKKILSCGNGGSLCDATHFAEELTGRYRQSRNPFPAICINDPAYMTCTANDFTFDEIYERYVRGVGNEGDILLAISTSGTSRNILCAAEAARNKKMKVIALTSDGNNPLVSLSDVTICAPEASHSDRIQEIHIKVIHILIEAIEKLMEERGLLTFPETE